MLALKADHPSESDSDFPGEAAQEDQEDDGLDLDDQLVEYSPHTPTSGSDLSPDVTEPYLAANFIDDEQESPITVLPASLPALPANSLALRNPRQKTRGFGSSNRSNSKEVRDQLRIALEQGSGTDLTLTPWPAEPPPVLASFDAAASSFEPLPAEDSIVVERTAADAKRKRFHSLAPDLPLSSALSPVVSVATTASTTFTAPVPIALEDLSSTTGGATARLRKLAPRNMSWYASTIQRQQPFGGTPMAPTPSAPVMGFGAGASPQAGASNGVGPYHSPANDSQSTGSKTDGLVFPALHLHPVNDTFAPKQISLSPPGPQNKVKIGRQTNPKTVPHPSNGYFDSKVLSRMHAEVWCQDGKMFIKDVKSSNGTFINGERLSAEAQESEVFELHNEDIVEFGIDIVGDDNKTIVHHKVACRVFLVFTAEDAMNMRNDFANLYRGGVNNHMGGLPQAGMGPGAEGGLRRGKSTMSFDHILGKLQMELQKSRETNSEIGSLNSSIGEIRETFGGGLPPMQEPPYPHLVPPPPPAEGPSNHSAESSSAGANGAVATLQAQLAETQSSISSQVDKIRALESMLAEHELIKAEVGSIKSQMAEAKRELDEMANAKAMLPHSASQSERAADFVSRQLKSRHVNGSFESGSDDAFDDGASIASMDTITEGADIGDAPMGADEIESEVLERNHVGPRAPPDLPPELAARDAAASAASAEKGASVAAKSAASLQETTQAELQKQNELLTSRLDALESQLEEALNFGRSLQQQHGEAKEAVKTLTEKVQALEKDMSSHTTNVQGKIAEALEGRFSQWKEQIESGWKLERRSWEEERDKLRQVIEVWDNANGKLEEQASHQIATAASSPSFTAATLRGGDAEATITSPTGEKGGRRRASKSARRRAAKRHLNPSLRALLYKDSHNNDFLNDDAGSSDDEDERASQFSTKSGGALSGGGADMVPDGASSSSGGTASTSAGGKASSLFSSEGLLSRASRVTTPDGSTNGDGSGEASEHRTPSQRFGAGLKGSSGSNDGQRSKQGFDNAHAITALSAAAVIVGVAAYATLGKDAARA